MAKGCAIFCAFGFVGLMIFCGVLAAVMPKSEPLTEAQKAERKQHVADDEKLTRHKRYVRELITEQLKAPSTAKFSLESGWSKDNELIVRGYVDSQNGFGAMIRTKVYAIHQNREKPELVYLSLGDNVLIDKVTK